MKKKGYWFSPFFKECFKDIKPSKKVPRGVMNTLEKTTFDTDIIKKVGLMSKEDILAVLYDITKNGQASKDTWNIIGYFEHNGSVLDCFCYWNSDDQGWDCVAYGVGAWSAGHGFWSRTDTKTPSLRTKISHILKKHDLPTRQAAISDIVKLVEEA